MFEYTKGVMRSLQYMDRQYTPQRQMDKNGRQNTAQTNKMWAILTPLKSGVKSGALEG